MKAQSITLTFALALSTPLISAYQGKMTNYQVSAGTTSCGTQHADSELVVALSSALMTRNWPGNPNNNPFCGTTISIWNPDTQKLTENVQVVDTCPGCGMYDIDASNGLFAAVADPNNDHGNGWEIVDWGGNVVGGKKRDLESADAAATQGAVAGLEALKIGPHHPHVKLAREE